MKVRFSMEMRRKSGLTSCTPEIPYLDITELQEGLTYDRVALVTSADPGLTKQNSGFARFFLKDVNSNVVCARLFDVRDFATCGVQLTSFRNKPVKLKFIAQEFNGSMSLIIDGSEGISLWDGEFDTAKFVGRINYDLTNILAVGKSIFGDDWVPNPEWETASIDSIGQGRVGAFMRVFDMSLAKLMGFTGISGVQTKDLMKTFYVAIEALFNAKKNINRYGVLEPVKSFDHLVFLNQKYNSDELRGVLLDTVKSIMGLGKPTHLYSHLVLRAINGSINDLELVLRNNAMVLGTSTIVGGVSLSKF